jgi:AcrR family transcriptional regulator
VPARTASASSPGNGTRQRLIDLAGRLFVEHSFAGTSLQMIADEFGITKAAVYHHFRTREELLIAVVEPVLGQLRGIVEVAETQRSVHARAEYMLDGYSALAVHNGALMRVLAADPGVIETLRHHPEVGDLINRQRALLADVQGGPAGRVNAAMVFAGIAGAARPALPDLDDEARRDLYVRAGRRILGLRTPRSPAREVLSAETSTAAGVASRVPADPTRPPATSTEGETHTTAGH